jgi:hypothetical protein
VELNPAMDAGNQTAELAASLVESALAAELIAEAIAEPTAGSRLGPAALAAGSHSPARGDLERARSSVRSTAT